jgi:hypothetical protein
MRRMRSGCCARAATDQAVVVLARPAMKLRRFIGVALSRGQYPSTSWNNYSARNAVPAKALMSALGQKRTSPHVRVMSALPPKADVVELVMSASCPCGLMLEQTNFDTCEVMRLDAMLKSG